MGVPCVAVLENGRVLEVSEDRVLLGETVGAGRVHVWGGRPVPVSIIRERAALAQEGAAFCFVVLDTRGRVQSVFVTTRGVMDDEEAPADLAAAEEAVRRAILEAPQYATEEALTEYARLAVRRTFKDRRGKKPVTTARVQRLPGAES